MCSATSGVDNRKYTWATVSHFWYSFESLQYLNDINQCALIVHVQINNIEIYPCESTDNPKYKEQRAHNDY